MALLCLLHSDQHAIWQLKICCFRQEVDRGAASVARAPLKVEGSECAYFQFHLYHWDLFVPYLIFSLIFLYLFDLINF